MINSSFSILGEQAQLPIFEVNRKGLASYVSDAFCELLKTPKAVLLGVPLYKLLASEELLAYITNDGGAITPNNEGSTEAVIKLEVALPSSPEKYNLTLWASEEQEGSWRGLLTETSIASENTTFTDSRFKALEELLINQSGTPLFNTLALGLLNMLHADVVFIGELMEGGQNMGNISMAASIGFPAMTSYSLVHTPCEEIMEDVTACYYSHDVHKLFPKDEILKDYGIEGYVGVPLINSQGHSIGIIVALYQSPVASPELAVAVLEMISRVVATEMERSQVVSGDLYRYKALINSMTEGVVFYDITGEVMTHNVAAEGILGTSSDELEAGNILFKDWDAIDENRMRVPVDKYPAYITLKTQRPCHNVTLGFKRKGEEVWLNFNTEPIWNDEGQFIGTMATFFDISSLKLAQESLEKSEERFRHLFDSMSEAIVIINKQGEITLANNAVTTCFGYKVNELLGKSFTMLAPPNQRKKQWQILQLFFQLSDVKNYLIGGDKEMLGLRANGTEIPIEINLTHIIIDHLPHIICSIRDMSQNRRYLQLETAYKKITDSVQYAKRIQMALLGGHQGVIDAFKETCIFFSPKDVVSGDFYWFEEKQRLNMINGKATTQSLKILIVADCTGHGVPGAFMAALGNAFIHEIVNEHHVVEPHHILSALNTKIITTLQKQVDVELHDGMDMGVIVLDEGKKHLYFAGARHSLYMIRNGVLDYVRGTGHSLGGKTRLNTEQKYEKHTIAFQEGDRFYLSTDGFQDQFGGPNGKKYMRSKFKQLLIDLCKVPMEQQEGVFREELETWRGIKEVQTDDVLVVGIEM